MVDFLFLRLGSHATKRESDWSLARGVVVVGCGMGTSEEWVSRELRGGKVNAKVSLPPSSERRHPREGCRGQALSRHLGQHSAFTGKEILTCGTKGDAWSVAVNRARAVGELV